MPSRSGDNKLVYKIVLYGPSQSGKTAFLEYLYHEGGLSSGTLQQLKDSKGNTLFFDRVVSRVANAVFQCTTVPGAKQHKIQRKTMMEGADGVIFVWDSVHKKLAENFWSFNELLENYGSLLLPDDVNKGKIPFVVVANKRDLQGLTPIGSIKEALNSSGLGDVLIYESIAPRGINVKKAFIYCAKQIVLAQISDLSGSHRPGKGAEAGLSDF